MQCTCKQKHLYNADLVPLQIRMRRYEREISKADLSHKDGSKKFSSYYFRFSCRPIKGVSLDYQLFIMGYELESFVRLPCNTQKCTSFDNWDSNK